MPYRTAADFERYPSPPTPSKPPANRFLRPTSDHDMRAEHERATLLASNADIAAMLARADARAEHATALAEQLANVADRRFRALVVLLGIKLVMIIAIAERVFR